jgi:hypothetical protein
LAWVTGRSHWEETARTADLMGIKGFKDIYTYT